MKYVATKLRTYINPYQRKWSGPMFRKMGAIDGKIIITSRCSHSIFVVYLRD